MNENIDICRESDFNTLVTTCNVYTAFVQHYVENIHVWWHDASLLDPLQDVITRHNIDTSRNNSTTSSYHSHLATKQAYKNIDSSSDWSEIDVLTIILCKQQHLITCMQQSLQTIDALIIGR